MTPESFYAKCWGIKLVPLRQALGNVLSMSWQLPLLILWVSMARDRIQHACEVTSIVSDSLPPYGPYSPLGSSVHGILQARILGCHFLLYRLFLNQELNLCLKFPALAGAFFTTSTTWEDHRVQWRTKYAPSGQKSWGHLWFFLHDSHLIFQRFCWIQPQNIGLAKKFIWVFP